MYIDGLKLQIAKNINIFFLMHNFNKISTQIHIYDLLVFHDFNNRISPDNRPDIRFILRFARYPANKAFAQQETFFFQGVKI